MNIRKLILFSIILLLPATTFSQSNDEEEIRYYDVEIVIFKNVQVPKGKEFILPVSLPSRDEEAIDFSSPEGIKAAAEKSFELIPVDELRMIDKVSRIIDSPYYELLTHQGWRQPGRDIKDSVPVWIRGGKVFGDEYVSIDSQLTGAQLDTMSQFDDSTQALTVRGTHKELYELEGKITIALSRYLHTYTDLIFRRPRLVLDQILDSPELLATLESSPDTRILDNYHMKERRRMRSKSLHYLDHPEFSLLILITPYEKLEMITEVTEFNNG